VRKETDGARGSCFYDKLSRSSKSTTSVFAKEEEMRTDVLGFFVAGFTIIFSKMFT
jgi:hypothetical protein